MTKVWPQTTLRDVLTRSEETVELESDRNYREITVRLWGKGVVERGTVMGAGIAAKSRFVARKGQFILSRIDSRNGALGIVPPELDGAVVTNDFPLFRINENRLLPEYLDWMCRTRGFVERCQRASEGTTNRVRLQEARFLAMNVPLPPLPEQRKLVVRIKELADKIQEIRDLRRQVEAELDQLLLGAFLRITRDAPRRKMGDIAPLIRRPVIPNSLASYRELGIRSFGKGTFQKPALTGAEIGGKRVFQIEPGDLLFSNVFAWEGAIAVAKPEDVGRIGSHRFITCSPKPGVATSHFLCFFFLTPDGLELIRAASPGGALRNRTLGLAALEHITAPVPHIDDQRWFDSLQVKVAELRQEQAKSATQYDALLPATLDRAFRGEI